LSGAWYNENNRQKAEWLLALIAEGQIAPGVVDERPIQQVGADDLRNFTQCHFFAGIGAWSYAGRRAGWPDSRPLWTGSCPCGPFSIAGRQADFADPRHLWPFWFQLISQCRPGVLLGEQVANAGAWLDLVQCNLETEAYTFAAVDLSAAGFGGAHIRQRYFWVADTNDPEWWAEKSPWDLNDWPPAGRAQGDSHLRERGAPLRLANTNRTGLDGVAVLGLRGPDLHDLDGRRADGWLAHPDGGQPGDGDLQRGRQHGQFAQDGVFADWLFCRDERWRPVEPGTFPLVDETPARLGRLRGYGDAVDAEVATQFVRAYMEVAPWH
jgi:DNA (cytosine-5)-methyltransferase 1